MRESADTRAPNWRSLIGRARGLLIVGIAIAFTSSCTTLILGAGSIVSPKMTRGYRLMEAGDCRGAIAAWQDAERSGETPMYASKRHLGIAGCSIIIGDLDAAEREARDVIERHSKYPDDVGLAHQMLAWIHYDRGDFDSAVASANDALHTGDTKNEADYRAFVTHMTLIRDGRALQSAIELGDCARASTLAKAILSEDPKGSLDIIPAGNRVAEVRRGGIGELAGLVVGDEIVSVAGNPVTSTIELIKADSALLNQYGTTVPVEIVRRGIAGEDAGATSPIERRMTIQVKVEYPEIGQAKRYLATLADTSGTSCKQVAGSPSRDSIPPRISVLEPRARDLTTKPVVAQGRVHFEVLASDDTAVTSVDIENQRAVASAAKPTDSLLLAGHLQRFAADVVLPLGARTVRVRASDSAGNTTETSVGVEVRKSISADDAPLFERNVALVIGINAYESAPPLEYAVADAKAMAARLRQVGFDRVVELYDSDASRARILQILGREFSASLGPDDRLIVFFAGHGQTEELPNDAGQEGYLVPFDGSAKDFRGTGISMTKVHEVVERIQARHVLLAFDSCYSGLGLKRSVGQVAVSGFIRKLTSQRAVEVITAGGKDEQAAESGGHGLFTKYLLAGLAGDADVDRDGYVTGNELGLFVRRQVSDESRNRQTPLWGNIAGDGDFVFEVRKGS